MQLRKARYRLLPGERQNFPGLVAVEYEKEGDVNQDLAQEVASARKLA